jgi:hypothetical protein
MFLSFSFLKIIYDQPKKKGVKGVTKIYRFLFLLAQEHEQDLNAKLGPYLNHYRAGNLEVHFKINI